MAKKKNRKKNKAAAAAPAGAAGAAAPGARPPAGKAERARAKAEEEAMFAEFAKANLEEEKRGGGQAKAKAKAKAAGDADDEEDVIELSTADGANASEEEWQRAFKAGDPKAFALLEAGVRNGSAWAQAAKAGVHLTMQQQPEAARLFGLAAAQGHADAMAWLATQHASGAGVPKNEREALRLYRKAAAGGSMNAVTHLGTCSLEGLLGVKPDVAEAVRHFRRAAEAGHEGGLYNMGLCCLLGRGVKRDEAAAVRYFERAAEECNMAEAQAHLARAYEQGEMGLEASEGKAAEYYLRAARQGFAPAQYGAARLLYFGLGCEQDIDAAIDLFKQAAAQMYPPAVSALQQLVEATSRHREQERLG